MAQFLTNERYGTGANGALSISADTTEAPIDSSCSGTATDTALTATNVSFAANQIILIHQSRGTGVGLWELNVVQSYTAGTITTKYALANTYTDSGASQAQVRVLLQNSAVTVDNTKTWTAKAWNENVGGLLAVLCNGTTTITGSIVATTKGYLGATARSNSVTGYQGEGTAGTKDGSSSNANGNGGGGGKVIDDWGGGGGGGNGVVGSDGAVGADPGADGGTGGTVGGATALTTMVFGGGGGSGAADGSGTSGTGGTGGGMVLIISKNITITGSIVAGGGVGGNGDNGGWAGGSGGGAGGSVLLKGQTLVLGTALITANAGAGGTTGALSTNGGAGGAGRIHADYSTSVSGTTTPTLDSTLDTTLADAMGAFLFNML